MRLMLELLFLLFLFVSANVFADEQDLYDFLWLDPDKSVYVLQKKVIEKEKSFYLSAGYLKSSSADFQDTNGFGVRAGYFFREEWGIELLYHKLNNSDDEAFENVTAVNNSVPFVRRVNSYMGGMVTWAPFYGKINTFNKIIYFDLIFGLGASKLDAESNTNSFQNNSATNMYEAESYTAALWKAELRVYINETWNVSLGTYNNHFKAKGGQARSKKKFRRHTDTALSVGLSF